MVNIHSSFVQNSTWFSHHFCSGNPSPPKNHQWSTSTRFNFMMNMSIGQLDLAKPRNEGYNDVYCFMATGYRCGGVLGDGGSLGKERMLKLSSFWLDKMIFFTLPLKLKLIKLALKEMVIGRLFFFFWQRLFSGAMLVLGRAFYSWYLSNLVNDTFFLCWGVGGFLKNMKLKPMRDQRLRKAFFCCNKKCCLFSCNFPNERSLPSIVVAGGKPTRRCDST